jgi:hypothetical protein
MSVIVTTTEAHRLVTGNTVSISGTDGSMVLSDGTTSRHDTNGDAAAVHVISPTQFVASLSTWSELCEICAREWVG